MPLFRASDAASADEAFCFSATPPATTEHFGVEMLEFRSSNGDAEVGEERSKCNISVCVSCVFNQICLSSDENAEARTVERPYLKFRYAARFTLRVWVGGWWWGLGGIGGVINLKSIPPQTAPATFSLYVC